MRKCWSLQKKKKNNVWNVWIIFQLVNPNIDFSTTYAGPGRVDLITSLGTVYAVHALKKVSSGFPLSSHILAGMIMKLYLNSILCGIKNYYIYLGEPCRNHARKALFVFSPPLYDVVHFLFFPPLFSQPLLIPHRVLISTQYRPMNLSHVK